MTDNERVKHIVNGDHNQFSFLMEKYHNEFFAYIYKITTNYHTTEDLLQDYFMLLYNRLGKYDESLASLRTWMYTILSNFMVSYLRKKKVEYFAVANESDFDYLFDETGNIESSLVQEDQLKQIVEVMKEVLNKKQLRIMTLYYFGELSVKEISETTNIPLKTIYKSIQSSIQKIRKVVETHE